MNRWRIGLIASVMLLVGCCPQRHIATTQSDSVRVEIQERIVELKDTVVVEIPKVVERQVVERDSSYLENDYAESEAIIRGDGKLYHSLETKPQEVERAVEIQIEVRDSIIYKERATVEIMEVERDLTWWQETQMRGFWLLLLLVGVGFAFKRINKLQL